MSMLETLGCWSLPNAILIHFPGAMAQVVVQRIDHGCAGWFQEDLTGSIGCMMAHDLSNQPVSVYRYVYEHNVIMLNVVNVETQVMGVYKQLHRDPGSSGTIPFY